jgi:Protein of unknown function (DUF2523)
VPIFIAALLGGLIQAAGTLVGKVLISLGIGYAVYTGLDAGMSWITAQISSSFSSVGAQTLAVVSGAGVGSAVNIVLSAISARLFLNGVSSGTMRKFVVK